MATIAISLGVSLAIAAAQAYFFPPDDIEGPRVKDFNIQNSAFGRPRAKLYGTMRIAGNVMDAGPVKEVKKSEDAEGGGIFDFLSDQQVITYEYYQTLAVGICEGTADVLRIWANNDLIYDIREPQEPLAYVDGVPIYEDKSGIDIFFFDGSETQTPSPALEEIHGAADTPAYRGTCYVVFEKYQLENGRVPNFEFEVTTNAADAFPVQDIPVPTGWPTGINSFAYDPLRNVVFAAIPINGGSGLVKYDALTGQILAYRENPWEFFLDDALGFPLNTAIVSRIAVDPTGHVWMVARGEGMAASFRYPYRIDPNTLLAVRESINSNLVDIASNVKKIAISYHSLYESYVSIQMKGTVSNFEVFRIAFAPDPVTGEIDTKGVVSNLTAFASSSVPSGDPNDHHWDQLGRLWIIADDQLHCYVVSIAGKSLLATYDLSSVVGSPSGFSGSKITHWLDANAMVIGGTTALIVWDILEETGSVPDLAWSGIGLSGWSPWTTWIVNDTLVLSTGGQDTDLHVHNLSQETRQILASGPGGNYDGFDLNAEVIYEPFTRAVWGGRNTFNNADLRVFLPRLSGDGVTLESIVTDITTDAATDQQGTQHIAATEYDFSALTDTVRGFVIDNRMTGRAAIEKLQQGFFFDIVESDWQLVAVKRGGASAFAIPEADLGAASDAAGGELLITDTIKERELPRQIDVVYYNKERDYQQGTEQASRESQATEANQTVTVDLPVVFTADEAATVALRALYMSWANRTKHKWTTTRRWSLLDPADVGTVTKGSSSYEVRVVSLGVGAGGVLQFEGASEDSGVYSRLAESDGGLSFPDQTITFPGATELFLMDLPLLSEADDNFGFYAGANGVSGSSNWTGAVLQSSTDGITFTDFMLIFDGATFGWCNTALPDPPSRSGNLVWTTWDNTSTVDVVLIAGSISTKTEAQVLDWGNLALIGNEVMQFTTATQVDGSIWRLSGLLRGRMGSESFVTGHTTSERFVMLSPAADGNIQRAASIYSAPMEGAAVGSTRYYRARTFNQTTPTIAVQAFANTAVRKRPYAPWNIQGSRDGSNNLTITWLRRDRFRGKPINDAPMSEASESYEIDVIETGSPNAVLRTITATSETASYTAAQQTADGFTPGDSVTVNIYQIGNVIVGRGYAGTATI